MAVGTEADQVSSKKRTAAAEYIAVEGARLARMADANGFRLLAYLIDMAVLEAWREASEPQSAPPSAAPRPALVAPE
jgi:hypothetical protein